MKVLVEYWYRFIYQSKCTYHHVWTFKRPYQDLFFRLFDESLRWLMANGRLDEAEKVVRKAAKMNKMSFDKVIMTVKATMAKIEVIRKTVQQRLTPTLMV